MNEEPIAHGRGASRRSLIKKGLLGGAILLVGGSVPIFFRSALRQRRRGGSLRVLTATEYAIFAAAAARLCPGDDGGKAWPSSDEAIDCAGKVDALLFRLNPRAAGEFRRLLRVFENGLTGLFSIGSPTPFTRSSAADQDRRLQSWRHSHVALFRSGYQAIKRLAHATYYSSPATYAAMGYPGPPEVPPFSQGPPTPQVPE